MESTDWQKAFTEWHKRSQDVPPQNWRNSNRKTVVGAVDGNRQSNGMLRFVTRVGDFSKKHVGCRKEEEAAAYVRTNGSNKKSQAGPKTGLTSVDFPT
ncbi:MAG TPA: hypothetical protein VL527_15040 [Dongiaceae bacterium]|jgi:hypothetical protein|nr:hypothetical protein [Dongiaceae bacterium]